MPIKRQDCNFIQNDLLYYKFLIYSCIDILPTYGWTIICYHRIFDWSKEKQMFGFIEEDFNPIFFNYLRNVSDKYHALFNRIEIFHNIEKFKNPTNQIFTDYIGERVFIVDELNSKVVITKYKNIESS